MKKILALALIPLFYACKTDGVETNPNDPDKVDVTDKEDVSALDEDRKVENYKNFDNGLIIKWFEHGDGEQVKEGDCIEIDYKVQLEDGQVVDGNHLLKKESMPFIVGFGMQTAGWDLALKELRVGDFVEIFIPSKLARGENGIKDLIPPNADNILRIRILARNKPSRQIDGNKVWIFEENAANSDRFGTSNEIEFHCMVSTPTNARYVNTFAENAPFRLRLEDNGLVPGLKKALINAKKSDRMYILVPSKEAYGEKGFQDVVKPGEDILYNVLVMDVRHK